MSIRRRPRSRSRAVRAILASGGTFYPRPSMHQSCPAIHPKTLYSPCATLSRPQSWLRDVETRSLPPPSESCATCTAQTAKYLLGGSYPVKGCLLLEMSEVGMMRHFRAPLQPSVAQISVTDAMTFMTCGGNVHVDVAWRSQVQFAA